VDRFREALHARPELALRDEEATTLVADQDVSLAANVERLGRATALVVRVERAEEEIPASLFVHLLVRPRALLHLERLHSDDREHVLVDPRPRARARAVPLTQRAPSATSALVVGRSP